MSQGTLNPRTSDNHQEHHPGISPHPLDETPEGHQVHQTLAVAMEEEEAAQEEAQAEECQRSTTTPSMNAFMKPFRMQLATYSDRQPVTTGTYAYLKTIVAGTPLPIYDGEDDLQVFMPWIHRLMCYFDLHQIVGAGHNHTRTTILYGALSGHAETWYEHSVRTGTRSVHMFPPDFVTILLGLADRFITSAAVTKAQSALIKLTVQRQWEYKPTFMNLKGYLNISYYLSTSTHYIAESSRPYPQA